MFRFFTNYTERFILWILYYTLEEVAMVNLKRFFYETKGLHDFIALVVSSSRSYEKTRTDIIKFFGDKKVPGVYVTLNKPCDILAHNFEMRDINPELIMFIDGISLHSKYIKDYKCSLIRNPERLSDMSVAIDQAIRSMEEVSEKFIVFDSLSTLLIFNQKNTVARYCHYLTGKMREWKIKGVLLSIKTEVDKELADQITQFCDFKVEVD